jgi:hypothetical protein
MLSLQGRQQIQPSNWISSRRMAQRRPLSHPPTSSTSHSTIANGRGRISQWLSLPQSNRWLSTHWFLVHVTVRRIHMAPSSNMKWQNGQCYSDQTM